MTSAQAGPSGSPGAAGDELRVERDGGVLVVTIDRPKARNAMTRSVARAIGDAMDELDADPELQVGIVTGAGGTFCAGMDLKGFLGGELPVHDVRGFGGLCTVPPTKPMIAAVEGYALAGGCELALACDMIVASSSATFGLPEATLGLVAGAGGLLRLPERIPRARAMELSLTGAPFGAEDAFAWGMVNRLVEPGGALAAARELAGRIAANGPLAVRTTKAILADAPGWPVAERWERQQALMDPVFASDDAREGARAFTEKRRPQWTGR